MMDFSAIPVKLGEPKRIASLGFGAGALILGVAVNHVMAKYVLFGVGLVAMSMTFAGLLNPVTVSPGLASGTGKGYYGAITPGFGTWMDQDRRRGFGIPRRTAHRYGAGEGSGIVDVGKGRVFPVYGDAYGASTIIPAGPATLAQAEVVAKYQAEPMYLRYVTGVENEGKIVGQGG